MPREPILQFNDEEQDPLDRDFRQKENAEEDQNLRPQRMRDMVGQREVFARLEIALDAVVTDPPA